MVEKTPRTGATKGRMGKAVTPGSSQESQFLTATLTDAGQLERLEETLASIGFTMPVAALNPEGWTLERPDVLALMEKLQKAGKQLGEYVDKEILLRCSNRPE